MGKDAAPEVSLRTRLFVALAIVALEVVAAEVDRRFGDSLPLNYLFILPVILGAIYMGYLGGIGVPLLSIAVFHVEQRALSHRAYEEADFLVMVILLLVGTVTAQIQADRRRLRRYSSQLEQLGKAREELAALIVHDLRTPLAGLANVLRLIAERDHALIPESHAQMLDLALATSEDMTGMINDLLNIHAMESGALALHEREVRPREIIEAAVRGVEPLARHRGISIRTELKDGLPALRADEVLVRRVLVNLLGNSLRFSPNGASIAVTAQRAGAEIVFSVSDEGPGIPADLQEKVFAKFARTDEEAGKHIAAGLGLAFAKMAVEAHAGRIWVESPLIPAADDQPGRGSRFSFSLPIVRP